MNKIEQWMNSRIGLNFRSGLDRMEQAVSLLGRPDKAYPILHVTGTNGKGSTIAFMRQLLMAHGKKVGTFTSPHMISIHDRICIGDRPISDEDFTRIGQEVQQMEQTLLQTQDQLSYFEIICLMALLFLEAGLKTSTGRFYSSIKLLKTSSIISHSASESSGIG